MNMDLETVEFEEENFLNNDENEENIDAYPRGRKDKARCGMLLRRGVNSGKPCGEVANYNAEDGSPLCRKHRPGGRKRKEPDDGESGVTLTNVPRKRSRKDQYEDLANKYGDLEDDNLDGDELETRLEEDKAKRITSARGLVQVAYSGLLTSLEIGTKTTGLTKTCMSDPIIQGCLDEIAHDCENRLGGLISPYWVLPGATAMHIVGHKMESGSLTMPVSVVEQAKEDLIEDNTV